MLFWQTAAEGEGDDPELDIDMNAVVPWLNVPLIEVVAPPAELDDVDDPEADTRIAATWLLPEA